MADKPAPSFKTMLTTDAAPTSTSEVHAIMTVLGGLEVGRVLILKREPMKVGRNADCTFVFDDAGISGQHCKFLYLGGTYAIVDDGSTNGTFLNGVRLDQAKPLNDGDRIQLGQSTQLKFSLVRTDERDALVRVYEAAFRDALSGAFNRKHLEERLDSELAFALRHNTELSLMILDLDHFKRVNDTYGHLAGDLVIKTFAELLMRVVRIEDIVARYGGEEFVVLTRGVPLAGAAALGERARLTVEGTVIPFSGTSLRVTCSTGVASLTCCGDKRDRATLLGLADSRLYKAKEAGRNRVASA